MYKELVEKLRHRGTLYNGISLFDDAANAIEKLLFKYNFANMTKKETDITLKNEFLKCLRLEAENKQLRHERDQVVKDLKDYEDIGLEPEKIKEILNAVNGGLAAKNGIWCPKCGDALDIDIVNGILAIDCFGYGEYTPVSELMKLHLNDAVPVVRCKDCKHSFERSGRKPFGCYLHGKNGITLHDGDDFCSYGERKEN